MAREDAMNQAVGAAVLGGTENRTQSPPAYHDALARVRAEYLEMPGLRLTALQVQRLCGLERSLCITVLDTLADAKFLFRTPDGAYRRV